MTRNEQEMYSNISSIAKSLEKIANVLEHINHDSYLAKQDIPEFPKVNEDDFDVHNDYLNDLVQGMNQIEYLQFHNQMNFSFASNDAMAMSNAIYELEYEECLGAIQTALLITGDSDYIAYAGGDKEAGRNFVIETLKIENTTQPENDIPCKIDGITNDSDYDVRVDAKYYFENLECNDLGNPEAYKFRTKKDCILDYVTTSFRDKGAKYTDIIKFAYYLGAHNAPKYTSENRGYYSCAFSSRMNGHLIQGGKDFLVKGINKNGKERYFTHSSVNKFTDYYKRID